MGEKALYNYASIACDVAVGQGTLCVDAYDNLGVDAYNADEYLEDGIAVEAYVPIPIYGKIFADS